MENKRSLSASTLEGDRVRNMQGEDLGKVSEIMLDVQSGCVSYVVLSHGGLLGMGDKLFAIPWNAMTLDMDNHEFVLDISRERLENAPGFDKTDWPDFTSDEYGRQIHDYYGVGYPSWMSGSTMGTVGMSTSGTFGSTEHFGTSGESFGSDFERHGGFEGTTESERFTDFDRTESMMDCDQPGLTEEERRMCEEDRARRAA
jgi:sporulation protein YlmC with PRC-barrel domain